jgi:hypothetical protein
MSTDANAAIDRVAGALFRAFTNKGKPPELDSLHAIFVASAVITKCAGAAPEIYTLAQFIEPRRKLLTDGRLVDFEEHELSARTEISGGLAQRLSSYEKSGVLEGKAFASRGVKTMQLVRVGDAWKITALAWQDEAT